MMHFIILFEWRKKNCGDKCLFNTRVRRWVKVDTKGTNLFQMQCHLLSVPHFFKFYLFYVAHCSTPLCFLHSLVSLSLCFSHGGVVCFCPEITGTNTFMLGNKACNIFMSFRQRAQQNNLINLSPEHRCLLP